MRSTYIGMNIAYTIFGVESKDIPATQKNTSRYYQK
jgi:hypothetical protein